MLDADLVKAYASARDFFLTLGYTEQNSIRPTLIVLKKRTEDCRVNLRISLNPVGDMQLYSASLLTIRCEYEIKTSEETLAPNTRALFETEIEKLRCSLIKGTTFETDSEKSRCRLIESNAYKPPISSSISQKTTVTSEILPGRISSGYEDLDALLLGGIPEKYAVVLTSPSCDEKDLLIKRFLEAGTKFDQTTFYITVDPGELLNLSTEFQSNFFLFICNPRSETIAPNQPNVFKLKGVENLTEIDIAMTRAFRTLDPLKTGPKRACIEIISDVLLQHHAVITRKWLSGFLVDLKSKGFTILGIINPQMHPPEEVQAILGLFEGEVRVSEKETDHGIEKSLRIRKMYNQRYKENELALTREKLSI